MPIEISGRSRGFTLVEMSIVLVIIGLIIGGILKGQEIIASARQKAVVNQVNAVRAAANTYFDRVGSSRVDLQACKLEYSIVSPK